MANASLPVPSSLDDTINAPTPDNDVDAPVANPVILRDQAANVSLLTLVNTKAESGDASNLPALDVLIESDTDHAVEVRNADNTRRMVFKSNGILFIPKLDTAAPASYAIGVRTRAVGDLQGGGHLWINGGTAQDGPYGGDVYVFAGYGNGGANNGLVKIAPFNTSLLELGASATPTDVKGALLLDGVDISTVFDQTRLGFAEFEYDSSTVDGDPGVGKFRLNNADPALATIMYIPRVDAAGLDVTSASFRWSLVNSHLRLSQIGDLTRSANFEGNGSTTNAGAYFKLPIISRGQTTAKIETGARISFAPYSEPTADGLETVLQRGDNEVSLGANDDILIHDGGNAITPLTLEKQKSDSGAGTNKPVLEIQQDGTTDPGAKFNDGANGSVTAEVEINPKRIRFKEQASLPSVPAGHGDFSVQDTVPTSAVFKDDENNTVTLARETQRITARVVPAEDIWRYYHYNEGFMGDDPWSNSGGSSTSDGTTLDTDPTFDRWDGGIYFPYKARLERVTFYWTPSGAHSTHDLYWDCWKQPLTEGATATPTQTRVFRSPAWTVDGTTNKAYLKQITTFDTDVLAADDTLNFFVTTLDANGNGIPIRLCLTIEYTRVSD